jgi:predicted phosphodiesterase
MKTAILSDIHGNLTAFEAVLADIRSQRISTILNMGDMVGYGPEPEKVVQRVRELGIPSTMGNHELGVLYEEERRWFNPRLQKGIHLTVALLSPETLAWCATLPASLVLHGCRCVHGFPPDSVKTYLFQKDTDDLALIMPQLTESLVFVGHTHELELVTWDGFTVRRRRLGEEIVTIDRERTIVNVGSVGQPRDGDNNAKYVVWDRENGTVAVRYVAYDIQATADAILERGFPAYYANRLW